MTIAPLTLETALDDFIRALDGQTRSPETMRAYRSDVAQFLAFLHETNCTITHPGHVQRIDLTEYLAHLAKRKLSGMSRARKVTAIRKYFQYLEEHDIIDKSPAAHFATPKREKPGRSFLTTSEYTKLLSLAGGNVRDYAMLQVFLQTGIRVSELVALTRDDIDLPNRVLHVRAGKGMVARSIALEKKAIAALKNYLVQRPDSLTDRLFLNKHNEPLTERGVRWTVTKYCKAAGITKKVSCHSLRHTFATYKAEQGVSPFQLQEWLGHQNLNTTQIYVHMARQNSQKVMEATSL